MHGWRAGIYRLVRFGKHVGPVFAPITYVWAITVVHMHASPQPAAGNATNSPLNDDGDDDTTASQS